MPKHQSYIAGVQYRDGAADTLDAMNPDTVLDLIPEPGNPHDPNAVGIWYGAQQLGYVPRDLAVDIAKRIDLQQHVECVRTAGRSIEIHFEEE